MKFLIFMTLFALFTIAISGCAGSYFNDASLRLGMEHSFGTTQICHPRKGDGRTISNLGFDFNLYESQDGRVRTNLMTTHHSCVFGPDREIYDSAGIHIQYKLFCRDGCN